MLEFDRTSFAQAIEDDLPVVVDFWAEWCMPCKIFAPVLEELADELDGKVLFGKVNIDDFMELAQQYGIASIPTVVVFKKGIEIERMVGIRPKQEVLNAIEKLL